MKFNRPSFPLLLLIAGFVVYGHQQRAALRQGQSTQVVALPQEGPVEHTWQQPGKTPGLRAELRGRVIDLRGAGVAGVKVADPMGGREAETEADGGFVLPVMRGKQLRIEATAGDGRGAALWTHAGEQPTLLLQPDLRVADPDAALAEGPLHLGEGSVHNFEGRVVVTVLETGAQAAAAAGGRFQVPLPNRPFHLIARDAAGQVARSAQQPAPRPGQALTPLVERLELQPGLRLVGTLRDKDGAPAQAAALELAGHGARRQLRTEENGFFEAEGLLPGAYTITALPRDGQVGVAQELELQPGPMPDLELQLRAEQPLELQVVDANAEPLAEVWVEAQEAGYLRARGLSDAEGRVSLRGLGGGELEFRAFRQRGDAPVEEFGSVSYQPESRRLQLR